MSITQLQHWQQYQQHHKQAAHCKSLISAAPSVAFAATLLLLLRLQLLPLMLLLGRRST